jgi:hypothetical protein
MRNILTISALLLVCGCGSIPPETVRLGSDVTVNDQNVAKICGDDFFIYALLWSDGITAYAIAVDDKIAPAFEKETRNFRGRRYIHAPEQYCLEVSPGSHKVTILAMRRETSFIMLDTYYYGECIVTTEADHSYLITPKRSGSSMWWHRDITAHIKEKNSEESVTVCEMGGPISSGRILELFSDLRGGEIKNAK